MSKTLSTMLDLGSLAQDFKLADTNSLTQNNGDLSNFNFSDKSSPSKGYLLAFICNHCPFVVHIIQPFTSVLNQAQSSGIKVAAISANDVDTYPSDSPEHMTVLAEKFGFEFPYLFDEDQSVSKAYTAACTPDFFLFDASGKLVYRGQFDDSRPGNGIAVTGTDLNTAIENLNTGQAINSHQKASVGCNIKWKAGNAPDYFG